MPPRISISRLRNSSQVVNQATFYMHNFGYDKLPTLGQTVAIGLALLAVLLILTICAIRRYAFSFSGTEGK